MIGAFETTFNKKSTYVYTALSHLTGYFIRKKEWFEALEMNENLDKIMRRNIMIEFITKIRVKVNVNKKKTFSQFLLRQDFEQIKASVEKPVDL